MKNIEKVIGFSLLFLTACDPVTIAVGGAVVAGTATVRDKEGLAGQVSDAYLKKKIQIALFKADKDIYDRIELAVKHGIVVVIGSFDDESQCIRAMEIVRKVKGRDVYDETHVQKQTDVSSFSSDSAISVRIESNLKTDGNVSSLNYDLTTVNGIVYICGTAMTPYERDVVLNIARTTSGVVKVVSYIKIAKPEEVEN